MAEDELLMCRSPFTGRSPHNCMLRCACELIGLQPQGLIPSW